MKNMLSNLKSPALISLLLVVPFMILEAVSTQNFSAVFNVPLFGTLWLLPMLFMLVLMPVMRNIRTENHPMAKPGTLIFSVLLLFLIAFVWVGIVADQMPCFLGVPNCD